MFADDAGIAFNRDDYPAATFVAPDADVVDAEYEDLDDLDDESENTSDSDFEYLDDDQVAGIRLVDLIREFGYVVAPTLKVCGVDDAILSQKTREDVYGFLLNKRQCSENDEDALQIVLHVGGGALKYTGAYVRNIGMGEDLEKLLLGKALPENAAI
jgi:hypothetical protein